MVSTFELADNIVGIMIKSDVDLKVVDEVHAEILKRILEHKRINLYVEID